MLNYKLFYIKNLKLEAETYASTDFNSCIFPPHQDFSNLFIFKVGSLLLLIGLAKITEKMATSARSRKWAFFVLSRIQ